MENEVYPYTYGTEPTTVGSAETIDQTHKACISGTYQDVTTGETTEWKWNCLGITENSMTGSTASCTASK